MVYFPDNKATPGVISTRGDANAARDAAGRKALVEQSPGSEFNIEVPEDLQACFDRLEEIRTECGELYSKMYGMSSMGMGPTIGPTAATRVAIQNDLNTLEYEEASIQARIMELQYVLPVNDQDGDAEEDEEEKGDMTQPEMFEQEKRGGSPKVLYTDKNHGAA